MLQFQKLLIQVPHLLSQGSKWQTNNFWKLYLYFWQLYVSFLTYFYSVGDWTYTLSYRHSLSNLTTSEVILMIMNNELWQKPGLTHVPPAWETYMLPTELFWRCLLEVVFIFNLQYVSHWLTHTLLPRTLWFLAHFVDSYFAPQNFVSWNTLLPSTFCFLEHFASFYIMIEAQNRNLIVCSSYLGPKIFVSLVSDRKLKCPSLARLDSTPLGTLSARLGSAREISARTHHY